MLDGDKEGHLGLHIQDVIVDHCLVPGDEAGRHLSWFSKCTIEQGVSCVDGDGVRKQSFPYWTLLLVSTKPIRSFPGVNAVWGGHMGKPRTVFLGEATEPVGDREWVTEARCPLSNFGGTKHTHSWRHNQCEVATRTSFLTGMVYNQIYPVRQ